MWPWAQLFQGQRQGARGAGKDSTSDTRGQLEEGGFDTTLADPSVGWAPAVRCVFRIRRGTVAVTIAPILTFLLRVLNVGSMPRSVVVTTIIVATVVVVCSERHWRSHLGLWLCRRARMYMSRVCAREGGGEYW